MVRSAKPEEEYGQLGSCPNVGSTVNIKSDRAVPDARDGDRLQFTMHDGGQFGDGPIWKFRSVVKRNKGCATAPTDSPSGSLLLLALLFVSRYRVARR